ncbi:uncharacterized protein LOC124689514 [Lolium rigidum]|uniref:uncharacterized protein LOC124689514 n=1 Tax=Lolium rigidum TaxID=89674 RepID=UPI001F5C7F37|nr:uncharacterized protein LOC124689514 [Lolium rigidum]
MGNSRGTARGAVGGSSDTGREDGVAGTPRDSGGSAARETAARSGANEGNGNAGSTGREDTGTQRAPGGPVIPALAARSGATGAAPRLPSRGGPGPRGSGPGRERSSTGPGNVMSPCSDQQQSGAASDTVKNSASGSLSRDSDRSAGSRNGAETPTSEGGRNGNATSLLKKRKRLSNSRNYVNLFKTVKRANDADVAVASPDRVGKENTSSGHVADSNISKLHKGSSLTENNKRHSSDAACKVSRSLGFGLHETSETRVNQDSVPVSEVQPRKPTDVPLQNITDESSLPGKARNRSTAPARQSCLSSLQSVPVSLVHCEEIKNTLGDGEPISVQKEVSASGHSKVIPSDQTDGNSNICVACGTSGTLRSCDGKGCQTRYHISCLDPSLEYLSPGIWFCASCTNKRFQFGLHSVVDGIESVWDVQEAEGMQNSMLYFVKYKNLAHVHNRWVPEVDINITPGGPDLLSLFNKRNHTEKAIWKEEWTKPHRLLRKRLLTPPKLADDFFSSSGVKYSYCTLEWLVKWRGLGYDHATWELETLPCLCTPEADQLKKNYKNRREAAKQSSIPTQAKVKQSLYQKLERLPDGCHSDFDNDHLFSINHLREFWYKSRGAVLVDDKEFVIKTVLFTMSVLPDVNQPILIVTTPASLSLWEVQFNTLAPFINVVVYEGGKDTLKLIQGLEFYESGSSIMLQVLLSHADAILEDIEPISRIGWEAVIVDYYQKSTLHYLEQLKQLSTDFRMLLVSSPIKDNLPEYMKLLDFLNSGEQENGSCVDTADALVMSKVNFKSHIAYERQADSSKISEHWVPAYISQMQLEIYCSILLSNSSILQSKMKSDGSLCGIIMSLSKCCDHPYLVDEFLQNSPVNNHDRTDTDTRVQACGKLLLLEKMLKETRNKRMRVIILFQSGVAGGKSMGDILEGVVCDRFGRESYERIESGAPLSRKNAALNMFNDKTKGRFVFLIESRACLPSVKLSSIDAVIIYNSDCNPLNDLKAIQRIKIESQKYPGIFRLYTPFTMEEKQLVLAKHGMLIGNYKDTPHSLGHSLISWGALYLFTRFDELQHDNYASRSFESDIVILELLKLATNVEDITEFNCTSISKANMSGEFYSRSIVLIGENVAMPALDGDPSNFWLNLLEGKSPRWSNISEPEQSSHRMVQNTEEPARVPAEEASEARRKRRKVDGITVPFSKRSSDNSYDDILPKKCSTLSPHLQQLADTHQKEGMKKLTTPKNLHVQLKQELSKLIKVLQLPDNARLQAEQFFEYYLKNHLVVPEPVEILHAFNMALCWRAASHVNYKIDRRESVALAEKSFNCEYNEALAGLIYTKLRTLKKKFPNRAGETSIKGQPVSAEDTQLSWQETSTNLENDNMFQNKEIDLHGNFTNGAPQEVSSVADETRKECHVPNDEPPNMTVEKNIDFIDNVFSLRKNNILCKQQLEISGLVTHRQNNVIRLKEVCKLVLEHIRRSHIDEMTRIEKIKLTAQWFAMLTYAFLEHMKLQHDKLEGLQSDTWSSECELKEKLHQVAKSGQLDKDFDRHIALPDSNFVMEEFIHLKEQNDEYRIAESSVSDCQQSSNDALSMEITLVQSEALSDPISIHAMENEPVETSVGSGGGPASEAVDFEESNIQSTSDGIIAQRAGCSSSTIPANDDSTGQESSTSECINTEHIEIDNIAKPIMLPGGATSLVKGVHANNDDILHADGVHLESPNLTSSQSLAALVGTQAVLSCMPPQQSTDLSAQQTVAPSQCPPAEAEQTGLSGTQAVQVLQPEMQPSILLSGAPPQRTHPDDRSQAGCQLDRATGLSKGGAATSHHLGDVRMDVQEKDDGNVVADPVLPESPTYPADSPVTLQVSKEVESHICEPSMAAKQSLAISRLPPAEAEPSNILGTEAAWNLQSEVQSSTSMQDEPAEGEDEPGAEDEPEVEDKPVGMVTAHDLQSEIQPSASVPAERSTCLPAQQSLATSRHPPAEAKQADILGTEPVCDLQPEVQPSTSDEPAEAEDEPEVPEEEDEPEVPEEEDEPPEAERAGTLGAIATQDLQPEMQSSTTHVEPSLDPHAMVDSAGMVTAHDPQSEILPSASVPTEQSTSLPAQQSLATSGHSPAEAEQAEATCDLQPSQSEVQVSTTMQDQPTEGEACILGAIAARSLQPGTQPSTSAQSAPSERTYLAGMPVLQSYSVEPSLDPHARAESTHTLGSLIAHDLHTEVHPSGSMQDRPAEGEGAAMLGSTAAQDLQPELQSSTTVHVPPERMHTEERTQIGFQPHRVPALEQPTQQHPVTRLVFNNPILSDEPLKNELDRLMHCNNVLSKDHEHKKSLLLIEYNQEIEKIKKKYDFLLQKEDSAYLHTQRELTDLYRKVFVNKSLADNFQGMFTPSSAAQGRSTNPVMERQFDSSAAQTAALPVISSSAIRPPGSYVRPPFVAEASSSSSSYSSYGSAGAQPSAVQPLSALASNLYRRTMSHVPPPHLPHGSYRSAADQLRAPSPHLQQPRIPSQHAMHTDQQQLPATSTAVASLGQYAPAIMGSYVSTVPQGGAVLNSMDPSSAHQAMLPPASSSRPARRASSLPPGRHPESMVNLQPSSSNPIFMPAQQQSPYPSMALGGTSGPQNAAPGIQQHRGARIAGVNHNQPGSEPASLNPYMPARFGLGSSPTDTAVVCLSDDE